MALFLIVREEKSNFASFLIKNVNFLGKIIKKSIVF